MRTVLVTGGAGFIGSHLVDQLVEGGAAVRVLDNLSTGSLSNLQDAAGRLARGSWVPDRSRLEVIIGDVRDRELLRKAVRGVKHVFHLAALPASAIPLTSPGDIHSVNVEGTLNVLHAALTEGVWRVVCGSCASVYGAGDGAPLTEDAPIRPTNLFAASKAAAETYSRAFHARHRVDTVTLRYFTVYGPRQRAVPPGGTVPAVLDALGQRRPFGEVDGRSAEDFLYVDDAVTATLAAARAPRAAGRVINVGSGEMVSIGEVVKILAGLMRAPVVGSFPGRDAAVPHRLCAETSLASSLLNFSSRVSLISGLARLIRARAETERLEWVPLAPVGLDD